MPGGNQVDGLPPALHTKTVGKEKSRLSRTTVLLTMINMFLNVIASRSVLVNSVISLSYTLRLLIKIVRPQNDRAISEFYPHEVFPGGDILMKILKNSNFSEKKKRKEK